MKDKRFIENLLVGTDIVINGNKPSDPQVANEEVYERVLRDGTIGLGESYMDGWWDVSSIDQLFYKLYNFDLDLKIKADPIIALKLAWKLAMISGKKSEAFLVGEKHYDIGNDLYGYMLDKRMCYSCGYWKNAETLDEAQEAKLDLICKKIGVKPGQTILDIGAGWGSFMEYAVEKYEVKVVGVTVSKKQKELFDVKNKNRSLEMRLLDYRDINEKFDYVVSIGMFEHVGFKNYRTFMEQVHKNLKDDGLFLLHTIGGNTSTEGADPWINKYIFPNGMLPSIAQIGKSIEGLFVMEDWHNFSADYDKTLMAWHKNFEDNWDKLKPMYSESFHRMWRYYLLLCAGAFRARRNQLWQIVLSKKGVLGGYKSIR